MSLDALLEGDDVLACDVLDDAIDAFVVVLDPELVDCAALVEGAMLLDAVVEGGVAEVAASLLPPPPPHPVSDTAVSIAADTQMSLLGMRHPRDRPAPARRA